MTNKWWIQSNVLILKIYKGRIAILTRKEMKSYLIIGIHDPTHYVSSPLSYCSGAGAFISLHLEGTYLEFRTSYWVYWIKLLLV
jgi:hypothetical protein